MPSLFKRNDALDSNDIDVHGQVADIDLADHGSYTYYGFAALFALATLLFLGWSMTRPRSQRIFYYIMAAINAVAFISYFTMGSNLGWAGIDVQFIRDDDEVGGLTRQIFWVRYVEWFITSTLILLALLLSARAPRPHILWLIFLDWVMVICGLVAALTHSGYKWAYFTFAALAMLYILYNLLFDAKKHARFLGADIGKAYTTCSSYIALIWLLYPIAFGVCEGGNVISPDSEAIFYSILDFFSKIVFGLLFLSAHKAIDPYRQGLHIRDYDEGPVIVHREKTGVTPGTTSGGMTTTV